VNLTAVPSKQINHSDAMLDLRCFSGRDPSMCGFCEERSQNASLDDVHQIAIEPTQELSERYLPPDLPRKWHRLAFGGGSPVARNRH
jgi:hypothetical protein